MAVSRLQSRLGISGALVFGLVTSRDLKDGWVWVGSIIYLGLILFIRDPTPLGLKFWSCTLA